MKNLLGLSLALVALQGCGSDSKSDDMMVTDDMAGPADMTVVPVNTGTLLMAASQYVATTTDDRVVVFAGTNGGASSIPVAGGTPTVIDAASGSLLVSRKTVFSWSKVTSAIEVGDLTIWSSAMSTPRKVSTKSYAGVAAATANGTYIAYAENSVEDGATDVVIGKADGTGTTTVFATGADTTNAACPVLVVSTGNGFLVEYCTGAANMDMGTTAAQLLYIDPAATTPAPVSVSTDAANFSFDKNGSKLWYLDSTKKLFYSALPPAGAATQVDTDVASVYMTQDGAALLWTTNANVLKRALTSAVGSPTSLVAAGAKFLRGFSEDDAMGFISSDEPNKDTSASNLAYLSITAPSSATKVVTDSSGVLYGPAFTSDSKIALWYDKNDASVANLHQTNIASGASTPIANAVWNHETVTATKILFMDNYKSASPNGKADLSRYDLAAAKAVVIANGAVARNSIDLSQDKSKVIYDFQVKNMPAVSGVYTAPAQ